ncbi:MAG: hypothetical protein ACFFAU_04540 [Candidatus Hodarchaeota archaeon]
MQPQIQIIHDFQVRNYTTEEIETEELTCLVQFLSSLDVCKSCVRNEIPRIQSSFDSDLDFCIDFEQKTLDIRYGKKLVSGW